MVRVNTRIIIEVDFSLTASGVQLRKQNGWRSDGQATNYVSFSYSLAYIVMPLFGTDYMGTAYYHLVEA